MSFFTFQFKGKGHLASCSINVPPLMIGFQSFIKTYHAPRHKAMIKKHFFPPQSGHQFFFPDLGLQYSPILFHYLVSNESACSYAQIVLMHTVLYISMWFQTTAELSNLSDNSGVV